MTTSGCSDIRVGPTAEIIRESCVDASSAQNQSLTTGQASQPAPLGSAGGLDERQEVRVDDVGVGRAHAVRVAVVDFQGSVFQQLDGELG